MDRLRHRHLAARLIFILVAGGAMPMSHAGPGDLDVRFGTHGQAEVPGQFDSAAMVALPDGRILVFGVPDDTATHEAGAIAIARMRAEGTPDTTFGTGGSLHLPLGADASPVPTDALLLPDGQVLVAGYFSGQEQGDWPTDELRSAALGWLLRLAADGTIDTAFGTDGIVRASAYGIDRIARLDDGTITAAGVSLLQRLDANGVPEPFEGRENSGIVLDSGYRVTALAPYRDRSVIFSAGFVGGFDFWVLNRVAPSGELSNAWPDSILASTSLAYAASLAPSADGRRLTACGRGYPGNIQIERWNDGDGLDTTFAPGDGNHIGLGADDRPLADGQYRDGTAWKCHTVLTRAAEDVLVVGSVSQYRQYQRGRLLLGHFDAAGTPDPSFGPPGKGLEIDLGRPERWSNWYPRDAELAPDGSLLVIAQPTQAYLPGDSYTANSLDPQRTILARVQVDASSGAGALGFNDAALRIVERAPGELRVIRSGGRSGAVSVQYQVVHDTTTAADIVASGTLTWPDGDDAPRSIALVPVDDEETEGEETFLVRLSVPGGGAVLGAAETEVTIEDDEALRALTFVTPPQDLMEGGSLDVKIRRPAATAGAVTVRFVYAAAFDPVDGSPLGLFDDSRANINAGSLRWTADDTSDRTVTVSAAGYAEPNPERTTYLVLADSAGPLPQDGDRKALAITITNDPSLDPPPQPPPPPILENPPGGGGGALVGELLALLAVWWAMSRRTLGRFPRWRSAFGGTALSVSVAVLLACGVVPPTAAGPGNLDVRFGTHGQAEVPGQFDSAAMVALPDGRILVFGVPDDTATQEAGAIAIARMRADGTPDPAFGTGGSLRLPLGADASPVPTDALLLPDGQVLVAGYFAGEEWLLAWPEDEKRSAATGWVARLTADGAIDAGFGSGGLARAISYGIDRIARHDDGTLLAAGAGWLQRLDENGVPEPFDGSTDSTVALDSGYGISALAAQQDGGAVVSAGFQGPVDSWYPTRVSPSGRSEPSFQSRLWTTSKLGSANAFGPSDASGRLLACAPGRSGSMAAERWDPDGSVDDTFAAATDAIIELGVDDSAVVDGLYPLQRHAQCRAVLRRAGGNYVVAGDKSRPFEYGGGRVLLGQFDAAGVLDPDFGAALQPVEFALGNPALWSSWHVTDAALAPDDALLLIAHRSSAAEPGNVYYTNALRPQRTVLARVEIAPAAGAGSIGFNDVALRIAERAPGELRVVRSGGRSGAVSAQYELVHGSTTADDIVVATGTLSWSDGDDAPRSIALVPVDDDVTEGEETFRVRLSAPTGGAALGAPEIEVSIEDDESLWALTFADPAPRVLEGRSLSITIQRPAATAGPIVVHYALAEALDPNDGSPRKAYDDLRVQKEVGTLRWDAADTTDRTLVVYFNGIGTPNPDVYAYLALADSIGTLARDGDWKALPIVVENDPALEDPPPPPPPPPTPQPSASGGGGALSTELLALLAALWAAGRRPRRWVST